MQSENMAKLLESGKVMSCGSWLLIPHHAGVDQSYTALQAGSTEILTFRNVNDVTWRFQDAHSFEVIDNFQLPIKYDRDNFMQFFRSDEFHEKISVDDAHEVFCQVLHGSSDFSKELLESAASDYEVDLASVLGFAEEDYAMLASENKLLAQFLENLGYTQDQISNIANSGINATEGMMGFESSGVTKTSFNANNYTNEELLEMEFKGTDIVITDEIMEMAINEISLGLTTAEVEGFKMGIDENRVLDDFQSLKDYSKVLQAEYPKFTVMTGVSMTNGTLYSNYMMADNDNNIKYLHITNDGRQEWSNIDVETAKERLENGYKAYLIKEWGFDHQNERDTMNPEKDNTRFDVMAFYKHYDEDKDTVSNLSIPKEAVEDAIKRYGTAEINADGRRFVEMKMGERVYHLSIDRRGDGVFLIKDKLDNSPFESNALDGATVTVLTPYNDPELAAVEHNNRIAEEEIKPLLERVEKGEEIYIGDIKDVCYHYQNEMERQGITDFPYSMRDEDSLHNNQKEVLTHYLAALSPSLAVTEKNVLYINANKDVLFTPGQTKTLAQILINTRDFCGNELGAAKQYCTDEKIDINSGIYREALVEADNIWAKARIDAGVIKSIASDAPVGATLADAVKAVSAAAQANKLSL